MTVKQVEDKLTELVHREPFVPFVVELINGEKLTVPHAPAFDDTGAGFIGTDGGLVDFEFKNVRTIRPLYDKPRRILNMTIKQIEEKMIELKHRQPFAPFTVEMADGQSVEVPHSGLAINESGAGFIGLDGGIVDVEFKNVRAIRLLNSEAAA